MAVLADLLGDRDLRLVPVVDTRRGDPVRWAATSELPDPTPFLEGGEVLLTTGLEARAWGRQWDGYVRRLARAGVVAVGLGVGLTLDQAPDSLARACRKHGVDLFEVPRATPFVAVGRALAAQLQAEEASATRTALEVQRRLTQAALREDEPDAVVEELARGGGMAAVVGADGKVLAGPYGAQRDLLDQAAVAEAITQMRPRGLRAATSLAAPAGTVLVSPIGVHGRPDRYLAAGFPGRVGDAQRSTVAAAVALLSLAEERRRGRREDERRLRARAVELLVAGDRRTAQLLLSAGGVGRLRLPRRATVLRVGGPGLTDALAVLEGSGLAGVVGDELVAVVRADEAMDLARSLVGVQVGVGEPGAPDDIPASHDTAGHALRLATADAPVVSWTEGVRHGVLALLDAGSAQAFAASYLAPLRDERELVHTLGSYLRHHGSLLKVAGDLGVHRNTVRHRVARIEALLDRSLLDPQVRADAWIALRSREQIFS